MKRFITTLLFCRFVSAPFPLAAADGDVSVLSQDCSSATVADGGIRFRFLTQQEGALFCAQENIVSIQVERPDDDGYSMVPNIQFSPLLKGGGGAIKSEVNTYCSNGWGVSWIKVIPDCLTDKISIQIVSGQITSSADFIVQSE